MHVSDIWEAQNRVKLAGSTGTESLGVWPHYYEANFFNLLSTFCVPAQILVAGDTKRIHSPNLKEFYAYT